MTKIAVVILNYNGRSLLEKFLPSVTKYSAQATVYVADNASTDGSVEFLRDNYPSIPLVVIPTNLGFCGGYNYALRKIEAKYYVLLNSDVEVTENWITPVEQLLDSDANIAAVQPKILSYADRNKFEYAGASGGMIDALGYPFCRGRIFDMLEEDKGQYDDRCDIFWATGACMFIRAERFHDMGGFDEDFFAHMEEIDLCWKLARAGNRVVAEPSSVVYHVGGGTLAAGHPRKTYYNFRNGLMMIIKHLPPGAIWWKLPVRIMLDWVSALVLASRSLPAAWAVLRAHGAVISRLGEVLRKRRVLRKQLGRAGARQIYRGSIVVDFFLKGRKRYSEVVDQ